MEVLLLISLKKQTNMFYKCPQCQKIWQYSIQKCPDCFSKLERQKSEKIKVIGVSKVNVPTIMHPITPYFALILEDENKNRWAHKSTREYKIGDNFETKTSDNKNAVAIWRIKYDVLEAIEKVVGLIENIEIKGNSKILILPTLSEAKHPYLSYNTTPQFLAGIIQYLIQKGVDPKNIKVAGQSFTHIPIEASIEKSQLLRVCQNSQTIPLDLSKTKFVKKEINNFNFEISEEFFKNDLIINLPILNLDSKIKVRGAVENILKCLKKESYLSAKYLYSYEDILTNIQKILPSYLTLGEAMSIQKQDRHVVRLGLVLAGFNPFNIDRIFAKITGTERLPEHLRSIDLEKIPIVGREIKEVEYNVDEF